MICLQGGGEFSPGCREMDAEMLARAGDGPVVVTALAGAVGREYATATANGVRHLSALGAAARGAPDVRQDAAAALAALREARLVVLPGGSPRRLLEAVTTTGVDEVLRDLLDAGGSVMGASAGAMVLCGTTLLPDDGMRLVDGLSAVPGVAVLPHFDGPRPSWTEALEDDLVLLGLPEESGVLLEPDRCTAVGRHASMLVRTGEVIEPGRSRPWPVAAASVTPGDRLAPPRADAGPAEPQEEHR